MVELWSLLGYLAVSAVSGIVAAGAILAIGGLGGHRALARRLDNMEQEQADISQRMTREMKKRASEAGVQAREDRRTEADVTAEAQRHLAAGDGAVRRSSYGGKPIIRGR